LKKEIIFDAIEFAALAHRGQFRKGTDLPYIVHPVGVGKTLIEAGCSEEIIAAGFLHDTVEDTPVTIEDIEKKFGKKIASIVRGVSEPDKSDTWENRKKHTIGMLQNAPYDVLMVEVADKLDNIRAIRDDYEKMGDSIWAKFKRGRDKQAWYYSSLVEAFGDILKEEPGLSLYKEFKSEVEKVFKTGL